MVWSSVPLVGFCVMIKSRVSVFSDDAESVISIGTHRNADIIPSFDVGGDAGSFTIIVPCIQESNNE